MQLLQILGRAPYTEHRGYDQIVKDVAEAQEVDVAIQIWPPGLRGGRA